MATDCDVVIIGAGHNWLVCAGYLAAAGLTVRVVERRGVVGGAAVTEEFHPGFRNSVCSYIVGLLHPKVIRDLALADHGLDLIPRPVSTYLPLPDGRGMTVPRDFQEAEAAIARFSQHDAARFADFDNTIQGAADVVRTVLLETPPNLGGGYRDLFSALRLGNRLRGIGTKAQRDLADLMTMSIGDYLDRWFENDALKGDFGYEAIVGNMVSPYAAGTAYVLLHHAFGEALGKKGVWAHARGGMGAVTQAMARSAEARGVHIAIDSGVTEVIVEGGVVRGVVLEDGTAIRARAVASNCDPKRLFLKLVDPAVLPDEFLEEMRGWRCRSGTFRMNVALSEMPRFPGLDGVEDPGRHLSGTINITPSLDYLERAYDDAKRGAWAREPVISMCMPSLIDDSLAPPGCHVMSLFCQHFHPELSGGRTWDEAREEVADLIIDTIDGHAPNFRASVLGRQSLSPLDLEREFGLTGGDIFHGALHLDQLYSLRPAAGHADYRMPVPGLYLCGSGAHPGGGVTGMPGHNAAREIARDFRRRRIAG